MQGFNLELVNAVVEAVGIPVIASSGAGLPAHFTACFQKTNARAALAAGIFHREEVAISDVKEHMADAGLPTRVSHVLVS
jgi:imidazole glycerol-phosphate synthase